MFFVVVGMRCVFKGTNMATQVISDLKKKKRNFMLKG